MEPKKKVRKERKNKLKSSKIYLMSDLFNDGSSANLSALICASDGQQD
jgi:hypothetical protein